MEPAGNTCQTRVSVQCNGQAFDAVLLANDTSRAPGIVVIPEIFGINRSLIEMAEGFVSQGFCILILDIFWRLQRNVSLGYEPADFELARSLHHRFDYRLGIKDVQAGINWLRAYPGCTGKVGVMGYCLGGNLAYLSVAHTDADAAASYYGTRLDSYLDEAPNIRRPLLLHLGRLDHRTPPPVMKAILSAVQENPHVVPEIYEEARHGFANHTRPDVYDQDATALANARTVAFFHSHLS